MDKRDYFLTIITTTILVCLVIPTVTYILLPLAAILIYAVNLFYKTNSAHEDQKDSQIEKEEAIGDRILHY